LRRFPCPYELFLTAHPTPGIAVTLTDGQRVSARWTGEKGGVAGFSGRLAPKGNIIKGFWFDPDSNVWDKDRAEIVLTLSDDGESFTAVACTKGNEDGKEWTGRRANVPREGGKIVSFGFKDKPVFDRLTACDPVAKGEERERARLALLAASVKDTADFHSGDGAITFIPGLAVSDTYDDSVMRKHMKQSRHSGKQLVSSVNISGRISANPKVPEAQWMADPYNDGAALAKAARAEKRSKAVKSLPPSLTTRKAFRATDNADAVTRGHEIFTSTLIDAFAADEEVRKLASESLRRPYVHTHVPVASLYIY
jgi:hypothetical protein